MINMIIEGNSVQKVHNIGNKLHTIKKANIVSNAIALHCIMKWYINCIYKLDMNIGCENGKYYHLHHSPLPTYVEASAGRPSRARKREGIKICLTNIMELYKEVTSSKLQVSRQKGGKMRKRLIIIAVLFAFAFTFPFALNALNVDEVLNKLDSGSRVSDTLSQDVTMRMTIPGAEKMQRMKMYKKGGDKVRIENLDRAGDVTIINGDNMLMKVDGKEVIKQVGEKDKESMFQIDMSSFNSTSLRKEFDISIKENRSDVVILKLLPKESNVSYNMIEMAIDKDNWRVKGQKMYSNAGITKMNIEYDNNDNVSLIKIDSPLPQGSDRGYMIMEYSNTNRGNISDDLFRIE